jgi:hypothetical protein
MEMARLRREQRLVLAARAAGAAGPRSDRQAHDAQPDHLQASGLDASERDASIRDASIRDASIRDAFIRDAFIRDASIRDASIRDVPGSGLPLLRVVLLDGVYNDARSLLRTLRRRLPAAQVPLHVALHPDTLSVYHRASGKSYAAASAESVRQGQTGDTEAIRICTVEAAALLLHELGEPDVTTATLGAAVLRNNEALGAHGAEERRRQRLARLEATPHQPRGSWARAVAAEALGLLPLARPEAEEAVECSSRSSSGSRIQETV